MEEWDNEPLVEIDEEIEVWSRSPVWRNQKDTCKNNTGSRE